MALSKFGNEGDLYGLSGGWQVPGMPGVPKKKNDYNVWNLPGVVAGGGGGTSVGSGAATGYGTGITYQQPEKSMSKDQRLRRFTDWKKRYGSGNIAIKQDQLDTSSYPDMQFGENLNAPWRQGSRILEEQKALRGIEEGGGGSWYEGLWDDAKELGLKGWGEIGIGAMNAYTGWQEAEMAKKQHALARETFDFQKAAYQQDREGRVLAYNTNAQNVNAWKEAQGRTDLNKLMV